MPFFRETFPFAEGGWEARGEGFGGANFLLIKTKSFFEKERRPSSICLRGLFMEKTLQEKVGGKKSPVVKVFFCFLLSSCIQ